MIVKKALDEILPVLEDKLRVFPWEDKNAYALWLSGTYQYVSHSVPLLKYAAERMTDSKLKQEMEIHVKGEHGHEKIALKDLKNLGFEVAPETSATTNLYSAVYKWIDENPVYIYGYTMALEYLSVRLAPEITERLVKAYGEKCSKFMHVHAVDDVEHTENTWKLFKQFSETELVAIAKHCQDTVNNYSAYIDDIWARSKKASKAA